MTDGIELVRLCEECGHPALYGQSLCEFHFITQGLKTDKPVPNIIILSTPHGEGRKNLFDAIRKSIEANKNHIVRIVCEPEAKDESESDLMDSLNLSFMAGSGRGSTRLPLDWRNDLIGKVEAEDDTDGGNDDKRKRTDEEKP